MKRLRIRKARSTDGSGNRSTVHVHRRKFIVKVPIYSFIIVNSSHKKIHAKSHSPPTTSPGTAPSPGHFTIASCCISLKACMVCISVYVLLTSILVSALKHSKTRFNYPLKKLYFNRLASRNAEIVMKMKMCAFKTSCP